MAGLADFNKRVTFQTYATSADGAGGKGEGSASTILSTWARVRDRGTSRSLNDFVDTIQKRKQIDVFYRSALVSISAKNHSILYNGVEYAIESKEPLEEEKNIRLFRSQ